MEWTEDREPLDLRATGRGLALAVAITITLTVFFVLVMAGVLNWAAGVTGL